MIFTFSSGPDWWPKGPGSNLARCTARWRHWASRSHTVCFCHQAV